VDVYSVAILTVSDRCSSGESEDTSGPKIASAVQSLLWASVSTRACVPDEVDKIISQLTEWVEPTQGIRLILTTGGTGLAPRDVTPEATQAVIERPHPGLVEMMRSICGEKNPRAYLSRAVAGATNQSLIINLPGSVRGAIESFESIVEILPHALGVLCATELDHSNEDPRMKRVKG
jgi:molybdenum cofactor synthesis domain-containing protein